MATRLTLHQKLIDILGSGNVYYNPPETLKMNFPCIVYSLNYIERIDADNNMYLDFTKYKIVLISKKVDHPAVKELMKLPLTRYSTRYTKDGFYHDAFILYQKEKQ